MTQNEALRLALEALEDLGMKHYENTGEVLYKETFTAIKAALEAKDEPVGTAGDLFTNTALERLDFRPSTKLYVAPPQRTWVGLTDEDLFSIYNQTHWNVNEDWNYERAIEAKLKEKNR